jgi:hypothetical protein
MTFQPDKPSSPSFINPGALFQMVNKLSGRRRYYGTMGSGKYGASSYGDPDRFQAFMNTQQRRANLLMNDNG